MSIIRVDDNGLAMKLADALDRLSRDAVHHAARNALNTSAFDGRKLWQREIEQAFTLRNKFTMRSVRVVKARGLDTAGMEAVLGSTADYLALQESGGTIAKEHKHGVPIPTPIASGESRGTTPRRRLVRRPNKLPNISLKNRRKAPSRAQRNAIAVGEAIRSGRRYAFVELSDRSGIVRIFGGKRNPRVEMVYDISDPSVTIDRTPTLWRAMRALRDELPGIHVDALWEQVRRAGLVGL